MAEMRLCCGNSRAQGCKEGCGVVDHTPKAVPEPPKNTEAWIMTQTGRMFFFENPHPRSIVIEDIAHALSQICRFTGHTKCHYSVAEHCVRVSWLAETKYGKPYAKEGLLHDASEAYMNDLNGPLKRLIEGDYRRLEGVAEEAIATKSRFSCKEDTPH